MTNQNAEMTCHILKSNRYKESPPEAWKDKKKEAIAIVFALMIYLSSIYEYVNPLQVPIGYGSYATFLNCLNIRIQE